jgi:hypothetical protein
MLRDCMNCAQILHRYMTRELCITSENDNYEVFGVSIRAKRAAHLSGQIANCLRPLGRVFAI